MQATEKLKFHAMWAGIVVVLIVITCFLFTISGAETRTSYACLGSAFKCNVTEVSTLGWWCGAAGVVAVVAILVAIRQWVADSLTL